MMILFRRLTWPWPVLLLLALAACNNGNPNEPTPPPDPNVVHYTAIGASDAIGFGASVPCFPFTDCPDGTGYVQVVTRRLRGAGKQVTVMNLGVPGAVLGPSLMAIGNSIGRNIPSNFLERSVPFVPRESTLVTIFAGGNDINTLGAAVEAGLGGADPAGYVNTHVATFGRDIRQVVAGVRQRAPNARIIALNVPNFAGLPFTGGFTPPRKLAIQQISVLISAQVNTLARENVSVIDLMCDPRSYQAAAYSSDGFHPNDIGYAFMAEHVMNAINSGSAPPPQAACPQMQLF